MIMKKVIIAIACLVCALSCNKIDSDTTVARYRFYVSAPETKAIITDMENFKFVCEAGDKIDILVRVLDKELLSQSSGVFLDGTIKFKYSTYLVYDGENWNLEGSDKKELEVEVKGKEGDKVEIRYGITNKPEGDYANWFNIQHVKTLLLEPGVQSITLDFNEIESVAI